MFIIVAEYSHVTPAVLCTDDRDMAERHYATCELGGSTRVTLFKRQGDGPCVTEIKSTGQRP